MYHFYRSCNSTKHQLSFVVLSAIQIIFEAVVENFSEEYYDGQSFFGTKRSLSPFNQYKSLGYTQSNKARMNTRKLKKKTLLLVCMRNACD